jgi:hypothetical protein
MTERTEFRCVCGYGIIVVGLLPACPMCQASTWALIPRASFAAPETGDRRDD